MFKGKYRHRKKSVGAKVSRQGHAKVRAKTMEGGELWTKVLSDDNKQRVVSKLKKRECKDVGEWPSSEQDARDAAVLVPMVIVEGEPSVLFTVRSQHVSRHRQLVRRVLEGYKSMQKRV